MKVSKREAKGRKKRGWVGEEIQLRAKGRGQAWQAWMMGMAMPFASLNPNVKKHDYA